MVVVALLLTAKRQGKFAILYGDIKSKTVWYEYEDKIITENEEV